MSVAIKPLSPGTVYRAKTGTRTRETGPADWGRTSAYPEAVAERPFPNGYGHVNGAVRFGSARPAIRALSNVQGVAYHDLANGEQGISDDGNFEKRSEYLDCEVPQTVVYGQKVVARREARIQPVSRVFASCGDCGGGRNRRSRVEVLQFHSIDAGGDGVLSVDGVNGVDKDAGGVGAAAGRYL